ncbi:hypothetical protein CMO91_03770 [Candidatus Woesearchaeota archaeon]|nr:hypothetical protein [Candidatus Woesearchaeota archaeon]|tara:strand:- start:1060 stop:1392 length:333 start_codon:yes stop_codon:yes gene_type:complete
MVVEAGIVSKAVMAIFLGVFILGGALVYFAQKPTYVGKVYTLQGQSPKLPLSTLCESTLRKCVAAPDPCPSDGNQVPCTWRMGPGETVFDRKSGCFKTCFDGQASLQECR